MLYKHEEYLTTPLTTTLLTDQSPIHTIILSSPVSVLRACLSRFIQVPISCLLIHHFIPHPSYPISNSNASQSNPSQFQAMTASQHIPIQESERTWVYPPYPNVSSPVPKHPIPIPKTSKSSCPKNMPYHPKNAILPSIKD